MNTSTTTSSITQIPVWLSADPGHDDAMAIIGLLASPEFHILGINSSEGNQSISNTTRNIFNILALANALDRDIPVVQGIAAPLLVRTKICPEIHGSTGLDGPNIEFSPEIESKIQEMEKIASNTVLPAPVEIFQYISKYFQTFQQSTTFINTGSLTNLALIITLYPILSKKYIKEIVLMGGSLGIGNTSPGSEFNIEIDPHASKIVFSSGIPLVMIPLETTHKVTVTPQAIQSITKIQTKFARDYVIAWMTFFSSSYKEYFGMEHPPLHDPCTIFYLLHPDFFTTKKFPVDIIESGPCAGRTSVDYYNLSKRTDSLHTVTIDINVEEFWKWMIKCIKDIG